VRIAAIGVTKTTTTNLHHVIPPWTVRSQLLSRRRAREKTTKLATTIASISMLGRRLRIVLVAGPPHHQLLPPDAQDESFGTFPMFRGLVVTTSVRATTSLIAGDEGGMIPHEAAAAAVVAMVVLIDNIMRIGMIMMRVGDGGRWRDEARMADGSTEETMTPLNWVRS